MLLSSEKQKKGLYGFPKDQPPTPISNSSQSEDSKGTITWTSISRCKSLKPYSPTPSVQQTEKKKSKKSKIKLLLASDPRRPSPKALSYSEVSNVQNPLPPEVSSQISLVKEGNGFRRPSFPHQSLPLHSEEKERKRSDKCVEERDSLFSLGLNSSLSSIVSKSEHKRRRKKHRKKHASMEVNKTKSGKAQAKDEGKAKRSKIDTLAELCQPDGPQYSFSNMPRIKGKKLPGKYLRDPHLPKRPLTPYIRFAVNERARLKEECPELCYKETSSMAAANWNALSPRKRNEYEQAYRADLAEYEKKKARYVKTPLAKEFAAFRDAIKLGAENGADLVQGLMGPEGQVVLERLAAGHADSPRDEREEDNNLTSQPLAFADSFHHKLADSFHHKPAASFLEGPHLSSSEKKRRSLAEFQRWRALGLLGNGLCQNCLDEEERRQENSHANSTGICSDSEFLSEFFLYRDPSKALDGDFGFWKAYRELKAFVDKGSLQDVIENMEKVIRRSSESKRKKKSSYQLEKARTEKPEEELQKERVVKMLKDLKSVQKVFTGLCDWISKEVLERSRVSSIEEDSLRSSQRRQGLEELEDLEKEIGLGESQSKI